MKHLGPIAGIAAYGPWVATAGYDNRLILWDASSRTALGRVNHDHLINSCAFSHDGRLLVSASSDYSVRIWSVPGLQLRSVLVGHGDDVDMARFSPNDRLVATCALDRIVRIFDLDGHLLHAMEGHTGNVLSLAWIDSTRLITSSVDGTLREWDASKGICLTTTEIGMRTDCALPLLRGGILAGDDRGRIALVNPGQPPRFIDAHEAGVKALVLAADERMIVSLGYDRQIAVWNLEPDGLPIAMARGELPHQIWARSAALLADGRVAVASFGGTYAIFDPRNGCWDIDGVGAADAINAIIESEGRLLTIGDAGILKVDGHAAGGPRRLCNFLVSARGRILAGGHMGELYDAASGDILFRHHSPLNCALYFERDGEPHLAVGCYTGEILLFALIANHPLLIQRLCAHRNAIKGLAAFGEVLMAVCANTDITWHMLDDGREIRRVTRAHSRIANACCPTYDGGFASVGRDRILRLWQEGGERAIETPHPNSVKCIAASPCGRWIASGSYGGTVAIFDRVEAAFAPMRRISKAGISSLCWSAASGQFLAADYGGDVHRIPVPHLEVMRKAA